MKKVLKVIVNALAWIILIFAMLVTILVFSSARNNNVANLFGFIPLTVESDSMVPTFKKDDLIICREIDDVKSLKEQDVITFWTMIEGQRVKNTHRIVAINEDGSFTTRGDNNQVDDELAVYPADLIGKWTEFKIGGFGKVMSFLRTKTGFFVCILIPMALFFLFELYKFIITLIEIKRPEAPELDEEEIKKKAIEEYLAQQKADAEKAEAEKKAAEAPAETENKPEEKAEVKADVTEEAKADEAADEKPEEVKADEAADDKPEEVKAEETPAEDPAPETEQTAEQPETPETDESEPE